MKTGSGKTYTMGTNYNGEEHKGGVIPKVMETIFSRVEAMRESTEFLIRVSFIEVCEFSFLVFIVAVSRDMNVFFAVCRFSRKRCMIY